MGVGARGVGLALVDQQGAGPAYVDERLVGVVDGTAATFGSDIRMISVMD